MYHVLTAADVASAPPVAYAGHCERFVRAELVGRARGAVHTGLDLCALGPGGAIAMRVHSFEESFYVLEGEPCLTLDDRTHRLRPHVCGLVPVGAHHAWSSGHGGRARWIEAHAPAPRTLGASDTFFTGQPAPDHQATAVDIRDPRSRTFFRRVRWLETQSPQPPSTHSYRFDRDWDYLAAQLGPGAAAPDHAS